MTWVQVYNPLGSIWLSALVAAIPLIILFYMLAVKRSPGYLAAIVATVVALLLAIFVWHMPVGLAVSATLNGMAFGLWPILWIIVAGLWVYNMTVESGKFEIIKESLASLTDDRRLQALFVAFAFGAFIEGTAGFGTPVAITAAMLAGLGFNPLYAAGVCLVANTAPVAFGSIGIPIVVAGGVSGIPLNDISKIVGRQLPFLSVIVPLWLVVLMAGWKKAMEVLPAVLVAGLSFALMQFWSSNNLGPYLPDILSSLTSIVCTGLFVKFWKPPTTWRFPNEPAATAASQGCRYSTGQIIQAWSPYILLAIFILLWGMDSVKAVINPTNINFNWPGLHNIAIKTAPIVAQNTPIPAPFSFTWLSSAGSSVFIAGVISIFTLGISVGQAAAVFCRTVKQLIFPAITIAFVLGLGYLTNFSGMSTTMALALASTGGLFPFFAPILGWLGVFLTGSDTSSNALFANLQKTTAQQLGLNPTLMVASNSSGGVVGKMISPQSIAVACAATGMVGEEGNLFRFTVGHSLAMLAIIAIMVYMQAYFLNWMLP